MNKEVKKGKRIIDDDIKKIQGGRVEQRFRYWNKPNTWFYDLFAVYDDDTGELVDTYRTSAKAHEMDDKYKKKKPGKRISQKFSKFL